MVRYLKLIVIIFGSIGLCIGSFFYLQNKHDISRAIDYKDKIDYEYLVKNCKDVKDSYYFPCLKTVFAEYLEDVSFTGTNIGMKMMFTVMDKDKDNNKYFQSQEIQELHYSINYLEINNMALNNAYRKYFGFSFLYGGFIATLGKNYERGFDFSQNIIIGLEGHDGISKIASQEERQKLTQRLKPVKERFYLIKKEVEDFIDSETQKLTAQQQ
jgi:hypothetical protein